MSKKMLLNLILLLMIIAIIYGIWAVQPLPADDWHIILPRTFSLIYQPQLPKTGQEIRYSFSGWHYLMTNPLSLFKPWSLLTAIFLTSLLWMVLIKESITLRVGLTLLTLLGFPYLGHIGAWNMAASMYTVSVLWMIIWYAVFRKLRHRNMQFVLKGILFFVLTFIAASWHEVWLITFAGIMIYFLVDAFSLLRKRDQFFKLNSLTIHLSIFLGYILAVAFYSRGGPAQFIDLRLNRSSYFTSLLNWRHIIESLLLGTKETLVLVKDSLPIFLLIGYIRLNKNFQTKLSSDFKLFLATAFGSILFIYVVSFISGPPDWRVRWLCVLSLSAALYALPKSNPVERFILKRGNSFIKYSRSYFIMVAAVWLSYNAYFTYVYTNIDVAGFLQYRQMVLDRNPIVLEKVCCRTLPDNRPKGQLHWDHVWGAHDNRYRIFYGPPDDKVYAAIRTIWNQEERSVKK